MGVLDLVLYLLAIVLFLLAGFGVPSSRYSLIAFGLAAWCAATLPLT